MYSPYFYREVQVQSPLSSYPRVLSTCHVHVLAPSTTFRLLFFSVFPALKKRSVRYKLGPCANFIPLLLAFLQTEITDFLTLSYTSTSEIPTLSYDLKPEKLYPFRGKPPQQAIKGSTHTPPPGQSTTLIQDVFRKRVAEFTVTATMFY